MEEEILIVPCGGPETYCRLCLSEANVETILFPDVHTQPSATLIDLIKQYVQVRVPLQPGTPCAICNPCRMMLEEFSRFRERCLRCDSVLKGEHPDLEQAKDDDGTYTEMDADSPSDCMLMDRDNSEDESSRQARYKVCPTCGLTFDTMREMRNHAKAIHGDFPLLYMCPRCPRKYRHRSNYHLHLKSHRNHTPFRCDNCDSGFFLQKYLRIHKAVYHNNSIPTNVVKFHKCNMCSRIFASGTHLELHLKIFHQGEEGMKTTKRKRIETCPTGQIQNTDGLLRTPSLSFSGGEIQEETTASLENNPQPQIQNTDGLLRTPSLSFSGGEIQEETIASLENYPQPMDNGTKPFPCPDCSISYHFIGSLRRHMRDEHGRFFVPKRSRSNHNKNTGRYNLVKNHQSSTAIAQTMLEPDFLSSTMNDVHEQSETILDEYIHPNQYVEDAECMNAIRTQPCSVYLQRLDVNVFPPIPNSEVPLGKFFHTLQVQAQKRATENMEDELLSSYPLYAGEVLQRFFCEICSKPHKSRMALIRHIARHNRRPTAGHKCPLCDRLFPIKASLDRHMPMHTNEFPFPCDECPLGFVRKLLLDKHKDRYHGPKPKPLKLHQCWYCPRVFATVGSLRTHMVTLHDWTGNVSIVADAEG